MNTKLTAENIKILSNLSVEDIHKIVENCTDEKHLKSTNWIFKTIGLQSFAYYIYSDFERIYEAHKDPTQKNKTKLYKALKDYRRAMDRSFSPIKLFIFIGIWIRSRRMEKVTIQLFTHLHSCEETEDFALELYITLKRNNAYYKTQSRFGNTNHTIEGIESIINSVNPLKTEPSTVINNIYVNETSNTTIVNNYVEEITNVTIVNNTNIEENSTTNINHNLTNEITNIYVNQDLSTHTTVSHNEFNVNIFERTEPEETNNSTFQFAIFQYVHKDISRLHKLALFLEKTNFIREKESFIYLFLSRETSTTDSMVSWRQELVCLCFLFKALVVLNVIKENDADKLWQKIADSFISISKRKRTPQITADTLSSISSQAGLTSLSKDNMEDWVKTKNNPIITSIHDKLCYLYK